MEDLKETIEVLVSKNTEAQTIIHGALNDPEAAPKGETAHTHTHTHTPEGSAISLAGLNGTCINTHAHTHAHTHTHTPEGNPISLAGAEWRRHCLCR